MAYPTCWDLGGWCEKGNTTIYGETADETFGNMIEHLNESHSRAGQWENMPKQTQRVRGLVDAFYAGEEPESEQESEAA